MLEHRLAPANTYVVTIYSDVAPGSGGQADPTDPGHWSGDLRWCIGRANADPGSLITFGFSPGTPGTGGVGGPPPGGSAPPTQTILLMAPLPPLAAPMTIDGTSYPAFSGTPPIQLDGTNAGPSADGLDVLAANVALKGLVISDFSQNGLVLAGGQDTVQGCYVGTDLSGTAALPNGGDGILMTSAGNAVGFGSFWGVVSGNHLNGIEIKGTAAQGNTVIACSVGVDVNGRATLPNGLSGVRIDDGAGNNTIGGSAEAGSTSGPDYALIISGNGDRGVYLSGSNGNLITGSCIGLGADGLAALGNASNGVLLDGGSSDNTIVGDVISDNGASGVLLSGSDVTGNQLTGDLIGTSGDGTAAEGNNGDGITLDGAPANSIGGCVVSGNAGNGITTSGGDTTVSGSLIGTNGAGTAALGNGNDGVYVASDYNTIGGTGGSGEGGGLTVLSGNQNAGIDLVGQNNQVGYCYVGTDIAGLVAVGNGGDGLDIEGDNNTVGTVAPLRPSVFSGNDGDGIKKDGASGVIIYYCYVGVDSTGLRAKPNKGSGVVLNSGSDNRVEDNVLSGNIGTGLEINDENGDKVRNNIIGLGSDGSTVLDQQNSYGIQVVSTLGPAANNTIGAAGAGNIISGNANAGVRMESATKTVLQGNYIARIRAVR